MADWRAVARKAAQRHGLDPDTFVRQIQQESGGRDVRSPAGAQGPAQFMPGTARSVGLTPTSVHQLGPSLDAAAKLMGSYVRKYGSYRDALVAYNAGPGRVGGSLPSETQNYLRTILGGRGEPSARSARPARGDRTSATTGASTETTTTSTPGVDNRAARAQLVQSFLSSKSADPINFALEMRGAQDVAPTSETSTQTIPGQSSETPHAGATLAKGHSPLLELIHNTGSGPGYAVKDGRKVNGPQFYASVWAGHANHVHVAAGPKTIVVLGRLAQRMGLHAGENPHFGGVSAGHVPGSYHFRGEAIDVSGDPAKMAQYARRVEQLYGLRR